VKVFSATVVAVASLAGIVAYFNGDTYTNGTAEATTMSGATVTAGGGTQTINANGARYTTLEADTVSGSTIRSTNGLSVMTNSYIEATTLSGSTLHTQTGVIVGDQDGAGCSVIGVLDGTVVAYTVTCP